MLCLLKARGFFNDASSIFSRSRVLPSVLSQRHPFVLQKIAMKSQPLLPISMPTPKSMNQQKYVESLNSKNTSLIFVLGPAGTGKTMFACIKAIQELKSSTIQKIIITRPVVTVEEDIGFLPGNIKNKMDPWTRPIFDIFLEYYSQREIDDMVKANIIEIAPLAFMRGRTFKKCFILADEMQNSSPNQMLMLTTRIGKGSKMVVTGDLNQSDRFVDNGLKDFIEKYKKYEQKNHKEAETSGIAICEMNTTDIERSPIVAKVLEIFSYKPPTNQNMDAAIIPKEDYYTKNKPLW